MGTNRQEHEISEGGSEVKWSQFKAIYIVSSMFVYFKVDVTTLNSNS